MLFFCNWGLHSGQSVSTQMHIYSVLSGYIIKKFTFTSTVAHGRSIEGAWP